MKGAIDEREEHQEDAESWRTGRGAGRVVAADGMCDASPGARSTGGPAGSGIGGRGAAARRRLTDNARLDK
jgi:hypothetical protein